MPFRLGVVHGNGCDFALLHLIFLVLFIVELNADFFRFGLGCIRKLLGHEIGAEGGHGAD